MHDIEPEEARNVLWYFGDREYGWEPGGFTAALLAAISKADLGNRALLGLGFPGFVSAMNLAQHDPLGLAMLRKIAATS